MEAKKFKLVVKICSACAAVAIFVLAIVAVVQFAKIGSLARKKSKLEKELNYLSATEESLKNDISKFNDINYSEQYAREHLGYIKDGDIIYEIY